jgi:hypothetical protein
VLDALRCRPASFCGPPQKFHGLSAVENLFRAGPRVPEFLQEPLDL